MKCVNGPPNKKSHAAATAWDGEWFTIHHKNSITENGMKVNTP